MIDIEVEASGRLYRCIVSSHGWYEIRPWLPSLTAVKQGAVEEIGLHYMGNDPDEPCDDIAEDPDFYDLKTRFMPLVEKLAQDADAERQSKQSNQ